MEIGPTKAQDQSTLEVMWGQAHLVAGVIGFAAAVVELVKPDMFEINFWAVLWFSSYAFAQWNTSRIKRGRNV